VTTGLHVVVVGGGPAGIAAALQSIELGARATLLEAGPVGGTSFNRGPAPVRTLARAARLARDWTSWATFGLEGPAPVFNLEAMLANSARVARYAIEKKRIDDHLRHQGVDLVDEAGPVHFTDPYHLASEDGRQWAADRVIIAVGGRAGRLPVPGGDLALTYDDLRHLEVLPRRAAVIGGADTGCQIASILVDLGVHVTLIEGGPTLLAQADAAVCTELERAFVRKGIDTHTATMVLGLRRVGDRIEVEHRAASTGRTTVDAVFSAVGWPGNIEGLALGAAGITDTGDHIAVDHYLRTEVDHIFAAGDVNGHAMLVQVARLEGRIAARNAVSGPSRVVSYEVVPSASFTDPEYGQVGLTEAEAARYHDIAVGIANYDDLLRPVADGRPEGFCKLIVDRADHRILGAHVLGDYSAEIIQVAAVCMLAGMTVKQVAELPFAFPTFTEAVSMAAQKICRNEGIGSFPAAWSYLGPDE